jgi:hypothetical protein
MTEMDGRPGARTQVQPSTTYVEDARTGADGHLRAVVYPGERTYSLGYIPASTGYPPQLLEQRAKLPAGEMVVVRFELHK